MNTEELMNLGFSDIFSGKLCAIIQAAIMKAAPNEIPKISQGKNITTGFLPLYWRKMLIGEKVVYFNVIKCKYQTDAPGIAVDEIEEYNYEDLKKMLESIGFRPRTIGKDIFSVFKKEGVTGKRLVSRSYNDLVSLKVPKEEAKLLRLTLAPLLTKADLAKLDVEDTCIWAEAMKVSKKIVDLLRSHKITGKKLVESKDPTESLKTLDIVGVDAEKIVEGIKLLNYENIKELGMSVSGEAFTVPKVGMSPLNSLLTYIPSTFYKTLEEALIEAKFICIKDILENAKKRWEASGEIRKSGLTEEEAAAVFVYTYDFGKDDWEKNPFRVVNKVLAERNTHTLPRLCGYILHLLSALRKLPKWNGGGVLYRGVEGPVSPSVREVGNVMSWPAFTSTTVDESTVGSFIASAREPVVFEIRGAFCGYNISPFSALGGESEVLLEPETTFRVSEVGKDKKFPSATRIVVDIIENPLMIEEMVMNFDKEKGKRVKVADEGISRWPLEEAVSLVKMSALEKIGTPQPYCTFKDAFERAGFGCTYEELEEEELKKAIEKRGGVPINSEKILSDTEALTIFSYTIERGGDSRPYRVVNTALAERNAKSLNVYPYIFHLLNALRRLPQYQNNGTLYRGIDGERLNFETHQVGNVLTWPAFTSTTYAKKKAYSFVQLKDKSGKDKIDKKIVFEITGPVRGYSVSDFSMYPSECEVLLEPENKFEITSIAPDPQNPGVTIISAKVIETPPIIPELIDKFMSSRKLPGGWKALKDPETGKTLYFNTTTKMTQEEFPEEKPTKALPPNWEERVDHQTGRVYYANLLTHVTQWDFPKALPPNWEERVDHQTGRVYYANFLTHTTQWNFPAN